MPTGRSSTISTDAPRRASSCAMAHPTIPAPTTMMSEGRPMKSQLSRGGSSSQHGERVIGHAARIGCTRRTHSNRGGSKGLVSIKRRSYCRRDAGPPSQPPTAVAPEGRYDRRDSVLRSRQTSAGPACRRAIVLTCCRRRCCRRAERLGLRSLSVRSRSSGEAALRRQGLARRRCRMQHAATPESAMAGIRVARISAAR